MTGCYHLNDVLYHILSFSQHISHMIIHNTFCPESGSCPVNWWFISRWLPDDNGLCRLSSTITILLTVVISVGMVLNQYYLSSSTITIPLTAVIYTCVKDRIFSSIKYQLPDKNHQKKRELHMSVWMQDLWEIRVTLIVGLPPFPLKFPQSFLSNSLFPPSPAGRVEQSKPPCER